MWVLTDSKILSKFSACSELLPALNGWCYGWIIDQVWDFWGNGIRKTSIFFPTFSEWIMMGRQLLLLTENKNALHSHEVANKKTQYQKNKVVKKRKKTEKNPTRLGKWVWEWQTFCCSSLHCAWMRLYPVGFLAVPACIFVSFWCIAFLLGSGGWWQIWGSGLAILRVCLCVFL